MGEFGPLIAARRAVGIALDGEGILAGAEVIAFAGDAVVEIAIIVMPVGQVAVDDGLAGIDRDGPPALGNPVRIALVADGDA